MYKRVSTKYWLHCDAFVVGEYTSNTHVSHELLCYILSDEGQ